MFVADENERINPVYLVHTFIAILMAMCIEYLTNPYTAAIMMMVYMFFIMRRIEHYAPIAIRG